MTLLLRSHEVMPQSLPLRAVPLRAVPLRPGFSLLEILLALAILGGSLAVLSQIADTGMSAARESRDLVAARMLCQSKLSEILLNVQAGITPQAVATAPVDAPFDSQSSSLFQYTVEVQPAPMNGLLAVRVLVETADTSGSAPRARYALTRWMIDPLMGLEAAEAEENARREQSQGLQSSTTVSGGLGL